MVARTKKADKDWGEKVWTTTEAQTIGFDVGTPGILLRRSRYQVWVIPSGRVTVGVFATVFWSEKNG